MFTVIIILFTYIFNITVFGVKDLRTSITFVTDDLTESSFVENIGNKLEDTEFIKDIKADKDYINNLIKDVEVTVSGTIKIERSGT